MTTSTVSRPAEPQRPAQANTPAKTPHEKPAATALFAALLNLVSDTRLPPDTPAAQADADLASGQEQPDANPLAALLAWTAPGSVANASSASARETAGGATGSSPGSDKPQAGGVDISGMTLVDESASGLSTSDGNPPSAPARPAFSNPAARTAASGRAPGEGQLQGNAPAMVWQRGAVSSTEALQQQHSAQMAQLAPVRSTVALDERFALSAGAAASNAPALREATLDTAALAGSATARPAGETVQGPSAPFAADTGGGAGGEHAGDAPGDALPGEQAARAEAGADAEGPTVSHWGTQHLRHASLRVGENGADAIDIQLSMKGQEVQVAFQSDNAEARASLREGASEALAELLQRSGIQLGQVSVGAQGQQHGSGAPQHTPTVGRGEAMGRDAAPAEAASPAQPRPRADGSQPLDLFV